MTDEQTDTQNSQPTPMDDAAASSGDADAGTGTDGANAEGGDDTTLLADAQSDAGTGDGQESDKADAADGQDDDGADGPPETYELKVTTQDDDGNDVDVEIDQALLTEATPVLKDVGLTNEQANKIAALVPKVTERVLARQADEFGSMKADWAKETKADPEIGGKNWAETENFVAKALDTFGAPSAKDADGKETNPFRALLNESGFGNHPEMIRMFRRIGEKLGEDTLAETTNNVTAGKADRVRELYPNDPPREGAK